MPSRLLAALALVLTASGCDPAQPSSDVNQDRVFARYELRYDRDFTKARTSFRFGGPNGTQLVLDGEANVSFEGQPLGLVTLPANITYYERPLDREARAGTFAYTNTDGRTVRNSAEIPAAIDVPSDLVISNDRDTEVRFTGPPVAEGEVVTISVFRVSADSRLAFAEQRRAGAQTVTLPVASIRDAAPGEVTVAVARSRTRPAEGGADSEIVEVYEAPLRTARISD